MNSFIRITKVVVTKLPTNCLECDFCEVKYRKGNVITVEGNDVGLATDDLLLCNLSRRAIPKYGTQKRPGWCLLEKEGSHGKVQDS